MDERWLPIIRDIPGFVAYYWVDAGDGLMISTSVFEDSSGEEESNWKTGQFVAQHLSPFMPNAPDITAGPVVAHTAK